MKIERVIAGALFDFARFLTTRKKSVTLSSAHDASPAVDAIREWAGTCGLNLDEADVERWTRHLPVPRAREDLRVALCEPGLYEAYRANVACMISDGVGVPLDKKTNDAAATILSRLFDRV